MTQADKEMVSLLVMALVLSAVLAAVVVGTAPPAAHKPWTSPKARPDKSRFAVRCENAGRVVVREGTWEHCVLRDVLQDKIQESRRVGND